jgi:hypothetical protein
MMQDEWRRAGRVFGGLKVELDVFLGHIRDGDGEVDEVLGSIRFGRSLSPED